MAEDLSVSAAGSIWATSGLAGGTSGNDAMTAPGTEPAEPLEGRTDPDPPAVSTEDTDARSLQHADDGGQAPGGWGGAWVNVNPGRRGPR